MQDLGGALEDFPSPSHTLAEGGHRSGEAADYVVAEVACASCLPTLSRFHQMHAPLRLHAVPAEILAA